MCLIITKASLCWHTQTQRIHYCQHLRAARHLLESKQASLDDPRLHELDRRCSQRYNEELTMQPTLCATCVIERGPGVVRWGRSASLRDGDSGGEAAARKKRPRVGVGREMARGVRGGDVVMGDGGGVKSGGVGREWVLVMRPLDGLSWALERGGEGAGDGNGGEEGQDVEGGKGGDGGEEVYGAYRFAETEIVGGDMDADQDMSMD